MVFFSLYSSRYVFVSNWSNLKNMIYINFAETLYIDIKPYNTFIPYLSSQPLSKAFTDEETKIQVVNDLPKYTKLIRSIIYCIPSCFVYSSRPLIVTWIH